MPEQDESTSGYDPKDCYFPWADGKCHCCCASIHENGYCG